jgi:phenylacetate-CoA ligase
VREVVAYAVATVPHYQDLFRELGLRADDISSADDLARLPHVDRPLLQREADRFRSRSRRARDALAFPTTGTTGMPVRIYHDRRSVLANIAYGERERAVEASFLGRASRPTTLHVSHSAATIRRVLAFYDESTFRPGSARRHFVSVDEPVERIVEAVNAVRPEVLRGYGAFLETVFRAADARGLRLRPPRLVVYAGDGMSVEGRRFIEERFGVPVISQYNAVEAFKIGYTCERRQGFHLHPDLCVVRVVGRDGGPVPPGESGEIVISNLVNRGTVLLNYRIGDIGRLTLEPCACGRPGPRLAELQGRVDEIIVLRDGTLVTPIAVWSVIRAYDGIARYQLVQHERDRFDLRFVTEPRDLAHAIGKRLEEDLRSLLRGSRVGITALDDLNAPPGEKFRPIVALAS